MTVRYSSNLWSCSLASLAFCLMSLRLPCLSRASMHRFFSCNSTCSCSRASRPLASMSSSSVRSSQPPPNVKGCGCCWKTGSMTTDPCWPDSLWSIWPFTRGLMVCAPVPSPVAPTVVPVLPAGGGCSRWVLLLLVGAITGKGLFDPHGWRQLWGSGLTSHPQA